MIDYIKLLNQEPEIKEQFLEVIFETIIADNPDIIQLVYTMLNVGIEKEQIIKILRTQMAFNKENQS